VAQSSPFSVAGSIGAVMRQRVIECFAECRTPCERAAGIRRESMVRLGVSTRRKRICEGAACGRVGQHRSCGNPTAFPAAMHMLSTEIHHRK
jgi:hypothetical protein